MSGILDLFALPCPPRKLQGVAIEEVFSAFESGKRLVLLEGPPGIGKSAAAVTLARHYGSTYICTLSKLLQAQYMKDFRDTFGARELKGRASYYCARADDTCAVGSRQFKRDPCVVCPYKLAKTEALAARLTVCNYASYFFNVNALQGGRRPLLVLDEGHETEKVLLDFISVTVDASALPVRLVIPLPDVTDVDACFEWLVDFLLAAQEVDVSSLSYRAADELDYLVLKATRALELRDREVWLSEPLDRKEGFVLKPLTVRSFGERLFRYGDRVLIMSATILDPEALARSLGIDDYAFVQAPCPFPKQNRPVVVGGLDMTKKSRDWAWPAMVAQIVEIMRLHRDDKGLLLTPSTEMLKYIVAALPISLRSRMILAYGDTRLKLYQEHLDAKRPTVLGASGLWEGVDLKDDASRFQIIPAVPRPYWGGQIAARGEMDPAWYRWRAYTRLVQGVGRSVRSETDSAVTYILDGEIRREADRSDTMLPQWFREAMEYA